MKKFLCCAAIIAIVFVVACHPESNKVSVDPVYRFDEAIIELPGGEILRGRVEAWCDYADSDQLQVRIDGTWYLVHSSKVVLISNYYE